MARPAADPFASFAGDDTLYQVRHLVVRGSDESVLRRATGMLVHEVLRLAPENLSETRDSVVFSWDPVYSTVTVTYTNADRTDDARDVLKAQFVAWDAELSAIVGDDARERAWAERSDTFERYLRDALAPRRDEKQAIEADGRSFVFSVRHEDEPPRRL